MTPMYLLTEQKETYRLRKQTYDRRGGRGGGGLDS